MSTQNSELRNRKILKSFALVITLFSYHFMFSQSGPKWSTGGNVAISGDFLGTSNAYSLYFKTNNVQRMSISTTGILQVNSLADTGTGMVFLDANGNFSRTNFPADSTKVLTGDGTFRSIASVGGWAFNNSYSGIDMYNTNTGNVGIGTNIPQVKLDVVGDVHVTGAITATGLSIQQLQADTVMGVTMVMVNNNLCMTSGGCNDINAATGNLQFMSKPGTPGNTVFNAGTNGNVGIGMNTPQYKLDVNGDVRVSGRMYIQRIVPMPGDSEIHFGDSSLVMGATRLYNNSGTHGVGLGDQTYPSGQYSLAIGKRVSTGTAATNSITLGCGVTNGPVLFNNSPFSFAVGFNSTIPTFYVGTASGVGTIGRVGIGTTNPQGDFQVGDGSSRKLLIQTDGKIIIGSQSPYSTSNFFNDPLTILAVDGRIMCKDLYVSTTIDWPDYVFDSTYVLMPLDTVSQFIKTNSHLPGSIPAVNMEQDGFSVSETASVQQKQIEEMMLYILQINERMKLLEAENAKLKTQGNK